MKLGIVFVLLGLLILFQPWILVFIIASGLILAGTILIVLSLLFRRRAEQMQSAWQRFVVRF